MTYTPHVKRTTWHRGRPDETDGVKVYVGRPGVFVAAEDLRQLARDLEAAADEIGDEQ
jgi:hypothetical protein